MRRLPRWRPRVEIDGEEARSDLRRRSRRAVTAPRLLDLLRAARATTTFFPIAPRAQALPALVRRMLDDGHTIGLHGDEHVRRHWPTSSWPSNTAVAVAWE